MAAIVESSQLAGVNGEAMMEKGELGADIIPARKHEKRRTKGRKQS